MNPRLNSSTKWTSLPQELTEQIKSVFRESFSKHLGKSQVIVEGRIYPEEITLRVGFLEPQRLKQNNFEVSVDLELGNKATDTTIIEKIHMCVDAIGSMTQDFFQKNEEELDLPYSWMPFDFNQKKVYLRHSTVNTELEAQADALLGESGEDTLYHDDDEK